MHIKPYTQSNRLLLTSFNCSLAQYVASPSRGLQPKWPSVLSSLPLPHTFINRTTWDLLQDYAAMLNIIATVLAPLMRVLFTSVTYIFLYFIEVTVLMPLSACFSITSTYLCSCSFIHLCAPCYCLVCSSKVCCIVCSSKGVIKYNVIVQHTKVAYRNSRWCHAFYPFCQLI